MKLKPIVPLMSLIFAATLTGCNLDGSSRDSDSSSGGDSSGGGSVVETSPLADGYWDIGSSTAAATLSGVSTYADAVDLPNVYVFDGTTQYYYDDDATPGTYVVKGPTTITEDIDTGTLSFTYYDSGAEVPINGTYSVTSGALTIDAGTNGMLSGTNESNNTAVKSAVEAANADSGIVVDVTDNFDDYAVGTNISEANPLWGEHNTLGDTKDTGPSLAIVSSDQAKSGSNSLLIEDTDTANKPYAVRSFANGAATAGSLSFDVFIPSSNEKTTYINLGAGKNNSDRYFELRLSGSGIVESETGDTDTEIGTIETDTWASLSIAWDGDKITVTINDATVETTQSSTGLDAANIPSQLTLYTGDTKGNANKAYFDNIDSSLF